ncbi:UDP-N-acetylmuramoyl-L-alanyl-D-glutamate--2,6-diaminopimelate ligase [Thiobacter aerophilum]|uniref:UDP-N-acetylmuramoyl-L-alanyl-D-glutamate--2,6-diaminopimelate ligase n=1 Tax=Thiobacter aerophilum TaxID=3121275 RepID=A0ABV0EJ91_9BURK
MRRRLLMPETGRGGGGQLTFDFGLLDALGIAVRSLAIDSRRVAPGDVFLAYPGERADGRQFIPQAITAGAVAVLWEPEGFAWDPAWRVPHLPVAGLRYKAGFIAAEVHGHPSRKLWMVGITGTNGKTSCSHWIAQAATTCGRPTAIIGTLGNGLPGALTPASHTTPDPVSLQKLLKTFVEQGIAGVAMEVSSHALDQGRVNGVAFQAAVLTNLSRDHLDYHGTMERYARAKSLLFKWPGLRVAVLNLDDAFGRELAQSCRRTGTPVLGYGFEAGEVRASHLEVSPRGLAFDVVTPWGEAHVASPILGRFNASNLLAVLATLGASGFPLLDIVGALARLTPVPGRMQKIELPGRPLVVVDYAHTPDALEKVLSTLREVIAESKSATVDARLICVFGCGGQRDRGKRPMMGEVASRLSDSVVVTSDNPRNEDPMVIIEDIVAGMGPNYHVVEDRAAAIDFAIRQARPGDVVLIAGKGHETYQEIRGQRLPFSDVDVARRALEGWK